MTLGLKIAPLRDIQPILGVKASLQVLQWLVGHQAQHEDHGLSGDGPLDDLEFEAHRHPSSAAPPDDTADTRSAGPESAELTESRGAAPGPVWRLTSVTPDWIRRNRMAGGEAAAS